MGIDKLQQTVVDRISNLQLAPPGDSFLPSSPTAAPVPPTQSVTRPPVDAQILRDSRMNTSYTDLLRDGHRNETRVSTLYTNAPRFRIHSHMDPGAGSDARLTLMEKRLEGLDGKI